jgi:RNA-binding protein
MISKEDIIALRQRGHKLNVVVRLGQHGLSDAVLQEIDGALSHHELLKIRVPAEDRTVRDQIIHDICERLSATLVQRIGHVALLFRKSPENSKAKPKTNRRSKKKS